MKLDALSKVLKQNLYQTCAWNTNPCAKPKSSNLKSDLIYKRLFANFL